MNNKLLYGASSSAPQTESKAGPLSDSISRKKLAARMTNDMSHLDFVQAVKDLDYFQGIRHDDPRQFKMIIELLKYQGMNAYRFSLRWQEIINPDGTINPAGIELYRRQILDLQEAGIEPIITFHHFEFPYGIDWLDKDIKQTFSKVATAVLTEFIPMGVKYWIPVNEAFVEADSKYFSGRWHPYKNNLVDTIRAIHIMADCSIDFYKIAHEIAANEGQEVIIMPALNVANFHPEGNAKNFLSVLAAKILDYFDKQYFIGILNGCFDAIAAHYYWQRDPLARPIKTDITSISGDPLNPDGIEYVIRQMYKLYNKQIFITEWGANISEQNDEQRIAYIERTNNALERLIADGIPIRAIFVWTLINNYEIPGIKMGGTKHASFGTTIPVDFEQLNAPMVLKFLKSFETLRVSSEIHKFSDISKSISLFDLAKNLVGIWISDAADFSMPDLIAQLGLLLDFIREITLLYPENAHYYNLQAKGVEAILFALRECINFDEIELKISSIDLVSAVEI